jgi:3-hydroxyisobutyrate dehydrogenase
MVSDTPDVESVVFGPDGVAETAAPGALLIDMSTIAPAATRRLRRAARRAGGGVARRAGLGGQRGRRNGTLSIMVGGDAADLERARPVLSVLGATITHVGPVGAGQLAKAMNQVVIAGTYAAVAEGIVLGFKAGIDVEAALAALAGGAAGSWGLVNRGPNVVRDELPARLPGAAAPQGPGHRARRGPRAGRAAADRGARRAVGDRA